MSSAIVQSTRGVGRDPRGSRAVPSSVTPLTIRVNDLMLYSGHALKRLWRRHDFESCDGLHFEGPLRSSEIPDENG